MDIPPSRDATRQPFAPLGASSAPPPGASRAADLPIRLARTGAWSVCYFLFYLTQQVAELLAPLLLILGLGWSALPHLVSAVSSSAAGSDPQARDVIAHVANSVPDSLTFAGHVLTPSGLIFDGILLMAAAAAGATLSALAARNL